MKAMQAAGPARDREVIAMPRVVGTMTGMGTHELEVWYGKGKTTENFEDALSNLEDLMDEFSKAGMTPAGILHYPSDRKGTEPEVLSAPTDGDSPDPDDDDSCGMSPR